MDPQSQVSVVIPAFNAGKFICETLKTIAEQTILPCEVIVVDDGSSDNTVTVVEEFSKNNPNLNMRILHEPHNGPGAARNAGVQASKGIWIAFLDSDDHWEPTKLERMAKASVQVPEANFLCHNEIHHMLNKSTQEIDYSKGYDPNRSLVDQLYICNRFSTSAVMCRRELIIKSGGFDISLPSAQDYELWIRMSENLRVLFVKEVLGSYIDRTGNISSSKYWHRYIIYHRVLYRHRDKVGKMIRYRVYLRSFFSLVYHLFCDRIK